MKILILTQIVDKNDPVLGFFHDWLLEFSKRFEKVTVICLKKGSFDLPKNVQVFSLGKELTKSRLRYLGRFFMFLFKERNKYDSVFIHMNPEYIILGGLFWRLMGKKIVFWYTHRQITTRLKIATLFANTILTAASESFRIKSGKVFVVGHGIDVKKFEGSFSSKLSLHDPLRIMSVGRITPIKNLDIFLEALSFLKKDQISFEASIIGGPAVASDDVYLESLKKMVKSLSLEQEVKFLGAIAPNDILEHYARNDISVNLTPTGGVDKAVLEAMAAGVVPLTSNQAFRSFFGKFAPILIFKESDALDLSEKIKEFTLYKEVSQLKTFLKKEVEEKGSVEAIVERISKYL